MKRKSEIKTLSKMMKKLLSAVVSASVVLSGGIFAGRQSYVYAEDEVNKAIRVEGENPYATNFSPSITYNETVSGGAFLVLHTEKDPPEKDGKYYATYKVNLPEAGAYNMTFAGLRYGASWASYIGVSVNGGEIISSMTDGVDLKKIDGGMYGTRFENLGGFVKGENTVTIWCMGYRSDSNHYIVHTDYLEFIKGEWAINRVKLTDSRTNYIYIDGDCAKFETVYSESLPEDKQIEYELTDFWGNTKKSGVISAKKGDKSNGEELGVLPVGHYTIHVREKGSDKETKAFMAVVPNPDDRVYNEESPFGLDGAFAWVVDKSEVDGLLLAEKLAGCVWNRDRMSIKSLYNSKGEIDFSLTNNREVFKKTKELGMCSMPCIVYFPSDMTVAENSMIADDLLGVYKFGLAMGKEYGNSVADYELWNEPEVDNIQTTPSDTADRFSGMIKALSLGIADSGTGAKVSSPGFTGNMESYLDLCLRNDMTRFLDAVNFHMHQTQSDDKSKMIYTLPDGTRSNIANIMDLYGENSKAIRLNEAGIIVPRNEKYFNQTEQTVRANYIVTANIESLSRGIEQYYWFVVKWRNGDGMAMFTSDDSGPYADYSAYSNMTYTMGTPEYKGTVNGISDTASGYVFKNKDSGNDVMVLWDTNESEFMLKTDRTVKIVDIMGGRRTLEPDGGYVKIEYGDSPIYVCVDGSFDDEVYTKAKRVLERRDGADRNSFTKADRVLIQQIYPSDTAENAKKKGYCISGGGTTVTVRVANLNVEPMNGTIIGESFDGWKLSENEIPVSLDPLSQKDFTVRIMPTDSVRYNTKSTIKFSGIFDGDKTTNSEAVIQLPKDGLYKWVDDISEQLLSVEGWATDRIGGYDVGSRYTVEQTSDGVRFKFDFANGTGDRWAFPNKFFSEIGDFTNSDGIVIRYKCDEDMAAEDKRVKTVLIVRESLTGAQYYTEDGFYMQKGEHEALVPWDKFIPHSGSDPNYILDTDDITRLSFGINCYGSAYDIPGYTIEKIGTYIGAEKVEKHGGIKPVYPQNGESVTDNGAREFTSVIEENEIPVDAESIKVYLDTFPVECSVNNDTIKVNIDSQIGNGVHKLTYNYKCTDGTAYNENVEFAAGSDGGFSDVSDDFWARAAIENLKLRNIVQGDENGKFNPNDNVTRAEFLKIADLAFGMEQIYTQSGFKDVTEADWFYAYVARANSAAAFDGIYTEEFDGDKIITRDEMAAILYRLAKKSGCSFNQIETPYVFFDRDDIGEYAREAVKKLQTSGVLHGTGNRMFEPRIGLTRAEAAQAVYNTLKIK